MISILADFKDKGYLFWLVLLAYLIAIVIAMCSHEYAHARVAYSCGDDTAKLSGRLTLNPLAHFDLIGGLCFLIAGFGWAKPVPINSLKFKEYRKGIFLTSIAGVITNFIICFFSVGLMVLFMYLISLLQYVNALYYILNFFIYLFQFTATINFSLCIFNLLPIYPLDGFNIINSLTKEGNKFVEFMIKYGNIILIIIFLTGIFKVGMGYAVDFVLQPIIEFWRKIIIGV